MVTYFYIASLFSFLFSPLLPLHVNVNVWSFISLFYFYPIFIAYFISWILYFFLFFFPLFQSSFYITSLKLIIRPVIKSPYNFTITSEFLSLIISLLYLLLIFNIFFSIFLAYSLQILFPYQSFSRGFYNIFFYFFFLSSFVQVGTFRTFFNGLFTFLIINKANFQLLIIYYMAILWWYVKIIYNIFMHQDNINEHYIINIAKTSKKRIIINESSDKEMSECWVRSSIEAGTLEIKLTSIPQPKDLSSFSYLKYFILIHTYNPNSN